MLVGHPNCNCPACQEHGDPEPEEEGDQQYQGYKDRYTAYYGTDWGQIRIQVLERDGYACQHCGISDEEHRERDDLFPPNGGLHIHHRVKAKEFEDRAEANSLDNLVALCASCHHDTELDT